MITGIEQRAPSGQPAPTWRGGWPPIAAGGVALMLAILATALGASLLLHLSLDHTWALVDCLLVSGILSLVCAAAATRLILTDLLQPLVWKIALVGAVGLAIDAINVYYTAYRMLIKPDQLGLLILLLLFSAVVSMAFALALGNSITSRMHRLALAAARLGEGDLQAQAPEDQRDEVGDLGRVLNRMATQLRLAAQRQSQVEESRRQLLAAVSHDLRTPIASIRAVVEALHEKVVDDPDSIDRYLLSARQQIGILETLIDDLFELSKLDAGALKLERTPTNLADIVSETLATMRLTAESLEVQLSGSVAPGTSLISIDARQVQRILLNLVSNALRHTPAGGAVRIQVGQIEGAAQVTVCDSGEGIPAEDLPQVFDRFFRGERSRSRQHGGAGLGLAIARGLTEAHGGHIWAESAPGAGTTIHFTLPT